MTKTKILVVDDDSGIGEMLKTLLEFNGYEVLVTEKPNETEDLVLNEDIDLVILDMLISGVNGTDICVSLKENDATAKTPVLMMSALHQAHIKCKNAGAEDFIAKPFEIDELVLKIKNILGNGQEPAS